MDDRGRQLLADGRVRLDLVDVDRVHAAVKGYDVAWSSDEGWSCSCLGWLFRRRCSHQLAVSKIVRLVDSRKEIEP